MSTNPPSFRHPFETEIAKLPDGVQRAHRFAFNGILDLNQAVAALKKQVDAKTSKATTTAAAAASVSSSSETIIISPPTIGFVNNQTGVTSYTTLQSDSGGLIVLDDASPIAITLSVISSNPGIQLPWFTDILNLGTGTATLTPATGLINYPGNIGAVSMPVASGSLAFVYFDGANFWSAG